MTAIRGKKKKNTSVGGRKQREEGREKRLTTQPMKTQKKRTAFRWERASAFEVSGDDNGGRQEE